MSGAPGHGPDDRGTGGAAPWLMLGMLFVAYIIAIIDRYVLALLAEPVKADLALTDTQLSLLYGLAFLILNSALQLPLGWLVDRMARLPIIAAGIFFWSLATMACGFATRFAHLAAARVAVGAGEAALIPASYSLIGDGFPRRRLGIAMGIFYLGGNIAGGVSLLVGAAVVGWAIGAASVPLPLIGTVAPWQLTFIVLGLPGMLLAALFLLLREPPRRAHGPDAGKAGWGDLAAYVRANRRWLVPANLAAGCAVMCVTSSLTWIVVMLGRGFGWSIQEAGYACGAAAMAGSLVGLLGGGVLSDRAQRLGSHRRLRLSAGFCLLAMVAGGLFPLLGTPALAVAVFALVLMTSGPASAGASANLQDNMPSRLRGLLGGLFTIVVNVMGSVIAPLLVALLSDHVFTGGDGVRYGMAAVQAGAGLLGALLFLHAARAQRRHPA